MFSAVKMASPITDIRKIRKSANQKIVLYSDKKSGYNKSPFP